MRKRIILIIAGAVLATTGAAAALVSTGSGSGAEPRRARSVVASFYPLAFAARAIGGARVEVHDLTPAGAEPHDLEVSPRMVERLRGADLVVLLGRGFQPQLEQAAGEGRQVLRLLDTPSLSLAPNGDPHVWLDPLRFARLARRIGEALGARSGTARFVARLRRLDAEFRRGLARCVRHEIVTSHQAFGYLARRYGLEEIAITGLSPEAEPTPGELARVVGLVRQTDATTIYTEPLVPPELARTVARETGAATAVLNPIEGLTLEEEERDEDYFSLMRANLQRLRRGLGCR